MPTSNIVFQTLGSWDSSTVYHMGNQIDCVAISLNLSSNSYLDEDPGGVQDGVEISNATILVPNSPTAMDSINNLIDQGQLDSAYDYCNELAVFPGEITISSESQNVRVVFNDPNVDTRNVQVFLDDIDVTDNFCELLCNINYIDNIVTCFLTITTSRHLLSHDNETITIL